MATDSHQQDQADTLSIYACFVSGAKYGMIVAVLTYFVLTLKTI